MELEQRIKNTTDLDTLVSIIRNPEPKQDNGFETSFARELGNILWYWDYTDASNFGKIKNFALTLCRFYKK